MKLENEENEEKLAKLLKRTQFLLRFNRFMFHADIVFAIYFLAVSDFVLAGVMAFCAFLAYDTAKRLSAQEETIYELNKQPERKNKTKVEDLYPTK